MPGELAKSRNSHMKSQVPKVLLNLNPGLNRQLNTQLQMLEKLKEKAERTADQRRHRFVMDFETRRNRRDRLYSRITKMDEDTRRAIDRITAKRRAEQREREERLQNQKMNLAANKQDGNGGKGRNLRGGFQQRRRDSLDSEDDDDDRHPANYSPTSAMRDYDEPNGINSRRSSLKSSSIIGYEGDENPGPTHTLNPLEVFAAPDKKDDGAQSSRKSSVSTAAPEVLVTRPADKDRDAHNEGVANNEAKPKNVLSLLPAPTPTRFVGKMHAIIAEKARPSAIPEGEAVEGAKDSRSKKELPQDSTEEIIKKDESKKQKSISDIAFATSFVGKMSRTRLSAEDEAEGAGAPRGWRMVRRKSRDESGSPTLSRQPSLDMPGSRSPKTSGAISAWGAKAKAASGAGGQAKKKSGITGKMKGKLVKAASQHRDGAKNTQAALQTATRVMGLYLKSHHKKTEDEVLDYFGAEGEDDSEDDGLLTEIEKRRPSGETRLFAAKEAQTSSTPISGALGLLAGIQKTSGDKEKEKEDNASADVGNIAMSIGTSRFVGKLHSLHAKQKPGPESTLEDITSAWSTGIPASILFLGKSFHAVPKGPGGIILHDSPKANSPVAKQKPPIADFSHTANMLTMLSKAETKMKAQAALKTSGGEADPSAEGESARNSPGQMLTAGMGRGGKRSKTGSRAGSPGGSSHEDSIARADQSHNQVPCNKLEGEDQTKKLLDSLLTVRPTSIPRWNEHKDVKEDKEREPFFFRSPKHTVK